MSHALRFAEFRLDLSVGLLLRDGEPVAIRRKLWDALCLLVDRRGKVVPLEELRDAVWHGVQVSEGSVGNLIYELRRLLQDPAARPRFIETIPARGLRFIGAVDVVEACDSYEPLVGREPQMRRLEAIWPRVVGGERQFVLVAGEAGIGKTQLIRNFVGSLIATASQTPRIATGRCVEREGGAEAYLPVFDLLDVWNQTADPDDAPMAGALHAHAPRWARQIAWAGGGDASSVLSAAEARPERMMREIASFFEAASVQRPLVLVFEDLHWADRATVDLLKYLATRTVSARLLVIATYRPAEALAGDHPVVHLRTAAHDRLTMLDLHPLSREDVAVCLGRTFMDSPEVVEGILDETMRRSGGNPLLVRALTQLLVDHQCVIRTASGWQLDARRDLAMIALPSEIETLVSQQLRLLAEDDRHLLETAAVAGEEMDAAAVAGGLGLDVESVDTDLRRHASLAALVNEVGVSSWPDGTTAGRFRFRHGLYREVLYRSLPVARRAQLHRRIGSAIEQGFAIAPQGVIAELAQHFEAAGDHPRAIEYLERAALRMISRSAIREAGSFFGRALGRVGMLPDDAGRCALEVRLHTGYGLAVALSQGLEAAAVQESYDAVQRLRRRVSDPEVLFPTLRLFWVFELLRFGYPAMQALNAQLAECADDNDNRAYRSLAASMAGTTDCFLGNLDAARRHLDDSLALCDDPTLLPAPQAWLTDARVETRCVLAWALWLGGDYERSRTVLAEARALADDGRHESTRGLVMWFRSSLAQLDNDVGATRAAASDLEMLARETDMPAWLQIAALVGALADLMEGDPAALEQALESLAQSEGNPTILIARAYLLGQLAVAYGRRGEAAAGLALVDMALARIAENGARVSEADLRRIRAELLAADGRPEEAEREFVAAIEVARCQGARALELRAATSRARLLETFRARQAPAARTALARLCAAFPADSLAHDVRTARAWLAGHASGPA